MRYSRDFGHDFCVLVFPISVTQLLIFAHLERRFLFFSGFGCCCVKYFSASGYVRVCDSPTHTVYAAYDIIAVFVLAVEFLAAFRTVYLPRIIDSWRLESPWSEPDLFLGDFYFAAELFPYCSFAVWVFLLYFLFGLVSIPSVSPLS